MGMEGKEKLISRLFGGKPNNENTRIQHNYEGVKSSRFKSSFNDTNAACRLGGGMFHIVDMIVLDGVAVARSVDGDIYVERHSSDTENHPNKVYTMLLNKEEGKIYAAVEEDGQSTPFDKKDFKYTLPLILPFYFVEENPDWKPKLEELISDVRQRIVIANNDVFEEFFDAVYFWGKKQDLCQITCDQIAHLVDYPNNFSQTNDEFGMDDCEFEFIVPLNKKTSTEDGPIREMNSNLDRLNALRDMCYPITEEYRKKMTKKQKQYVPTEAEFETYIVTKKFERLVKMMAQGLSQGRLRSCSAYLESEPGTGKTTVGSALAYVFGLPLHQVQFSANADESELVGTTIAKDGEFNTTSDTEYMEVHKNGGVVILDDINYAKTGVPVRLNSALEAPFRIKGADNELYSRHPFSIVLTTVNPTAKGAHPINEAFRSRHGFKAKWSKLPKEKMVEMVMAQSGFTNKAIVTSMVDCVELINASLSQEQIGTLITPRDLVDWAINTKVDATPLAELGNSNYVLDMDYINPIEAAEDTILAATNLTDEDSEGDLEQVRSTIAAKFLIPRHVRNELGI